MTTPTLLTRATLADQTFTSHRALFVTPRGGCGVRTIYRINRKTVSKEAWMQAWEKAAPDQANSSAA